MGDDPILSRTLRALALNRTPGFNYPGHFLQLSFDRVAADGATVSMDAGPHCEDRDGQVDMGPFALLADIALAVGLRKQFGVGARLATVSLGLQLSGAPRRGRLEARTVFDGLLAGAAERQGLTRGEIRGDGTLLATASGTFMVLGAADATDPHPLPRRGEGDDAQLPAEGLDGREREIFQRAQTSLANGGPSFIERFWGYLPETVEQGATCTAPNGPQVGNRVGHAQGGFTFGLAASTAAAALAEGWNLVGANAWYVGPGIGRFLTARATIVHRGTLTAVVRTRIEDEEGRGVLEAVTSHAKRG